MVRRILKAPGKENNFVWHGIGCLIVLFLCSIFMFAQEVTSPPAAPSYLMRMERLRRDQDSCVLVRGDGQYHFEILYRAKTDIFEAVLPADELRILQGLLSQDRLFQLQQKDIHSPLLESGLDQLTLSILRPGHWQNLSFPGAESREPYRDVLDPLLKWFERAEREKGRKLEEESGRNNCNPPHEIRLKQRTAEQSPSGSGESVAADEHRPPLSNYVVRMSTSQIGDRQVEDMCLIVFENGVYHQVRRSQKFGSKGTRTTVLDGSFSSDEIHSLRAILDAEELQKYVSYSPPLRLLGESTVTHLTIPRIPKPQQITVWKNFDPRGLGGARIKAVEDHGSKLVKPLNEWLKAKITQKKDVESVDPPNPKCLPTQ